MNLKEKLDTLVDEGWLISQVHPTLDLTIYNYSQKTQYEGHWTPETLMCRGLVLNSEGVIVARPFPKFFNAEEVADQIPLLPFEAYEKMDGSLGIFFWYYNKEDLHPVFASRGSFTSEQAVKGWELLQKLPYHDLAYGATHMFEIIYPENRIVVDYGGAEKLVLLGIIQTSTGREIRREDIENHLDDSFELVNRYHIKDSWDLLKSQNEPNREGYVLLYPNGFRVKVKFADYVRLHRIITGVSNIDIWERLRNDEPLDDLLELVPDEFYAWVRATEKSLREQHADLLWDAHEDFNAILKRVGYHAPRKEYALEFLKSRFSSIFFKWLDGKKDDAHRIAWDAIRPVRSKPFAENI